MVARSHVDDIARLRKRQQAAFTAAGEVPAEERVRRLQQVIDLLVDYHEPLVEAMGADFGGRHPGYSLMNDVLGSLGSLKYVRDHLASWMEPEARTPFAPYDQLGAEAWVMYQPKGAVGIIGTWNAPLFTLLSPLACVLGAGNRAVLKPSELAPRTAEVLAGAVAERIDPSILAVVTGGVEIGAAFAAEPFDHLVFTGSTAVGRKVMAAAAANLVPVTLELGGKSPAILGRSADLAEATRRLALAKSTNGGQLCISPDLLYVPRERLEETLEGLKTAHAGFYPRVADNPDAVPIINDAHLARLDGYLDEAVRAGTRVETTPDEPVAGEGRRRPLRLVVDPPRESRLMQEEIFGPLLVVLPYDEVDAVIEEINARTRPLALYYFGEDADEQRRVLGHTLSGGVTINDALMHAAMHDAPFGGVGASGMGHYHGREGFKAFSHMRTVFRAPDQDPRGDWGMLPPYGEGFLAAMKAQVVSQ